MPADAELAIVAAERVAEAFAIQQDLGLPASPRLVAAQERRKAGRPPGSRSRHSASAAAHVLSVIGDPLLHQAAIATMGVEELMALGLTIEKALEEKRLSAALVLPYLHQRQALAVDVNNRQEVTLIIEHGAAPEAMALAATIIEADVSDMGLPLANVP